MKIFEQNFVGIDHNRDDITMGPLAFLTPYEDNAAGQKRQETVQDWLRGYGGRRSDPEPDNTETRIVDNKPRGGFRIVDFAARWSTSNKVARVYDPEGYELEIGMPNLIAILLQGGVVDGEVLGECVWGREGAQNWLVPVNSDLYKKALKPGQVLTAQVGDRVIGNHGYEYVYMGVGYIQPVVCSGDEHLAPISELDQPTWYDQQYDGRWTLDPKQVVLPTVDTKPSHVYAHVAGGWRNEIILETRKQPMKITANLGPNDEDLDHGNLYHTTNYIFFSADGTVKKPYGGIMYYERTHEPGRARWHTRLAMFCTQPTTVDDIDHDRVLEQLKTHFCQ